MTRRLRLMGLVTLSTMVSVTSAYANVVTDWSALAVQCIAVGAPPLAPSRPGPPGLLDLALVHVAMHDAIQAIEGRYEPYLATPTATGHESVAAAAAAAAHRVLSLKVCPTYLASLDAAFKPYLDGDDPRLAGGVRRGRRAHRRVSHRVAASVHQRHESRGMAADAPRESYPLCSSLSPRRSRSPSTSRSSSGRRRRRRSTAGSTFAITTRSSGSVPSRATRPRASAPLRDGPIWRGSGLETSSRNGTKPFGSSPSTTNSRSAKPHGCWPSPISRLPMQPSPSWDSKHHYNFWRPITAIREGDLDGNHGTKGDPAWTPFIQSLHFPAGSQTPPYPDYTSGANGLTGAFVTTLQLFFRTDRLNFEVYKATPASVAICSNPRQYQRLSDAADEVVDARVWLGIHFRFADEAARRQGKLRRTVGGREVPATGPR